MLKIITSMKALDFGQLKRVYEECIRIDGEVNYKESSQNMQVLQAEQDFYGYLKLFFQQEGSICAVWAPEGVYQAALRLEPYADGLLLAGLETAPGSRRRGYAKALIKAVVDKLENDGKIPVYSHVNKHNFASITVHNSCGFARIMEYAVYSDGSVLYSSCTFCKRI